MRLFILLIIILFGVMTSDASAAKDCSPAEKEKILERATPANKSVRLNCNLTLRKGEKVTKQIQIRGAGSSGVRLVCQGGVIGIAGKESLHFRKDIIQIKSVNGPGNQWSRPENVVVDGCEVNGAIRISGLGPNGQSKNVKRSSRGANHTRLAQDAAPKGILLKNLVVRGDGRVPVYFSPGVTHSKFVNSRIIGNSISSGLYLDAESAHNTIGGNTFAVKTPREILSIDGSAHNIVTDNRFHFANMGGVYIYRNCGEGGAARHQKPQFNLISKNSFYYNRGLLNRPTIWVSFRNIQRKIFICPQDSNISFGSGIDDRNFSNQNTISFNAFFNSPMSEVIRDWGGKNRVFSNRRLPR